MTQPLNFTPKAIEGLLSHDCPGAPATKAGMAYLAGKLREAQVFVLSDHGQLLPRSKPRPEVPLSLVKPPFPVVALEYTAQSLDWDEGVYTAAKSTRRIALAWEYTADEPAACRRMTEPLPPGVIVASVCFYDNEQLWLPVMGAAHIAYDEGWTGPSADTPFKAAALASGRMTPQLASAPSFPMSILPLMPDVFMRAALMPGGIGTLLEHLNADLMDEVNAYVDLCMALACKNVSAVRHAAPAALNRQRLKAGKLPLKDFHVLELASGGTMPGGGGSDRAASRTHLRRGHIRRLDAGRVTWVNATIVRGRGPGFIEKAYAI
jgi:hypothetical protein